MQRSLQLEGVEKVEMKFEDGLFILTVGKTALDPEAVARAVPKRYRVAGVEYESEGEIDRGTEPWHFKAEPSGMVFELEKGDEKAWKAIEEGKVRFRLTGEGRIVERKNEQGKKVKVLVLVVSGAEPIEEEEK